MLIGLATPAIAHADPALVPTVSLWHNYPVGTAIGPEHFRLGRTVHGSPGLNLALSWKTADGSAVGGYCHEYSKVVDSNGHVEYQADQRLGGGCTSGGNWKFGIKAPGTYTYLLDVTPEHGANVHAEQQFTVDP